MARLLLLVAVFTIVVGCEKRTPAPASPAPAAAPARASQPKGAVPPVGLTADDYHEIGEVSAGDRVYFKGVLMETMPFDEKGHTLGLLSVECPKPDEPLGPEARAFTLEFLGSKQTWIDTPWKSKTDPAHGYAYVYRCPDGAFLNAELVRRGFARVKDVGRPETAAALRGLEEEARAAKVGIWK